MNPRQARLMKYVLLELREADGTPMNEAVLHFQMLPYIGEPEISLTELREALGSAEAHGFCRGLPGALGTMKWAITDKGRLADIK